MQNRGFTLIEVLVAGALASVVLVGTFLLFQGGINQATTLNRNQEFDMVELGIRSCLLSSPLQSYRGSTGAVWYSTQWCGFGTYRSDLAFTGVTLTGSTQGEIVSREYSAYFFVASGSSSIPEESIVRQTVVWPSLQRTIEYSVYR